MAPLERSVRPKPVAGAERAFEVKLGALGGVEVRPTRVFLWKGDDRHESERLLSLADRPVGLEHERRESTIRVGQLELRSRGNPLMTLAMAGAIALRRFVEDDRPPERPPG
jgi:hypothetical protein